MHKPLTGAHGGVLVPLVVLAVAVLGGLYFFSDVFRTKVQATARDLSEWTPENIAADPVGYLDFCETETKKTQTKLEASRISVAQRRAQLVGMKEKHETTLTNGSKALEELKTAYRAAETAGQWPLSWAGRSLDQEKAKLQIVELHREVQSKKGLIEKVDNGLKSLDAQVSKLQQAKATCEKQLAEIQTSREMLKVEEITQDLTEQLIDMKGVLASTTALIVDEDTGPLGLEEAAETVASQVDDAEFAEIMK